VYKAINRLMLRYRDIDSSCLPVIIEQRAEINANRLVKIKLYNMSRQCDRSEIAALGSLFPFVPSRTSSEQVTNLASNISATPLADAIRKVSIISLLDRDCVAPN